MNYKVSDRERQILMLAAEGLTDKEIAARTSLSIATVRTYWDRIRSKTGASNRSSAIIKVLGEELVRSAESAIEARSDLDTLLGEAEQFATFGIGIDGKIKDWNAGVFKVLGFLEPEFVGIDFAIVFAPDDVKQGEPERELRDADAYGRCVERRYHMKKDGTMIWIDGVLIAHRDKAGRVRGYSKIMRDDTERKGMEEEIQRLRTQITKLSTPS